VVPEASAEELVKLNNFQFAGANLGITEIPEGWPQSNNNSTKMSQASMERKSQLQEVLRQRYDPESKLLNLSSLGEDPILIGMGYLEDKDLAQKTFKVLMSICDETFPSPEAKRDNVLSITLANNNIDNVIQVFDMAETFPDLKNLDLSGNQLSTINKLNRWRGRLRSLETLLLAGNPLETNPESKEIIEWFPKLMNLNNVRVRSPEEIAAAEAAKAASRPSPLPQNGADFRDASGVGETFLTQFLPLYDSNRAQAVAAFYDDQSHFSLSVSTQLPRDNTTPTLPWAAYLKFSRNLSKIHTTSARVQRLIRGGNMIKELWGTLPATKHPDLKTGFHKYIVDCHPLPGLQDPTSQSSNGVDGLIISMHGEFEELDASSGKTGMRSFSRTFVLGPAAPGSNLVFRIVSDMLALRAFNGVPTQPSPGAPTEQDPKQQLILELSRQTNMTPHYSQLCLEQSGWDLAEALSTFAKTRVSLHVEHEIWKHMLILKQPNLGPEAFMASS
jgi:nuclear RNA export factor